PVRDGRHEAKLDEQADAVEHEEQHRLAAPVAAPAVPERPELVAKESEHGRHHGGYRHRGERAEPHPVVEHVGAHDRDEERADADGTELGYLVYQHPESGVETAEEVHALLTSS